MKKGVKKKTIKKKISKVKSSKKPEIKGRNVEKIIIENFVSLQKVMTNLSVSFNELSSKISKLLELFELSAQALAKKEINFTKPMDEKKIMDKLESLSDQNKTIARGLTLMHERIGEEIPAEIHRPETAPPTPSRIPAPPKEKYQKSPFSKGF